MSELDEEEADDGDLACITGGALAIAVAVGELGADDAKNAASPCPRVGLSGGRV